jgi:hypothetical protein
LCRLVAGYALFGSATDGDVLKNLTAAAVGTLVPRPLARALAYGIGLAFSGNLLVNFVLKARTACFGHGVWWAGRGGGGREVLGGLVVGGEHFLLASCADLSSCLWLGGEAARSVCPTIAGCNDFVRGSPKPLARPPLVTSRARPAQVWAVRESVCELALGAPPLSLGLAPFYALTALLVAAAYGVACVVPSIYALLALVGSTACVTFRQACGWVEGQRPPVRHAG